MKRKLTTPESLLTGVISSVALSWLVHGAFKFYCRVKNVEVNTNDKPGEYNGGYVRYYPHVPELVGTTETPPLTGIELDLVESPNAAAEILPDTATEAA